MNGFQHLNLHRGQVKIRRHGRRLRIAIDGENMARLTVEIEDGDLTVLDADDAVLDPGDASHQRFRPAAPMRVNFHESKSRA